MFTKLKVISGICVEWQLLSRVNYCFNFYLVNVFHDVASSTGFNSSFLHHGCERRQGRRKDASEVEHRNKERFILLTEKGCRC